MYLQRDLLTCRLGAALMQLLWDDPAVVLAPLPTSRPTSVIYPLRSLHPMLGWHLE